MFPDLKVCLLVQQEFFASENHSLKKTMIAHSKSKFNGLLPFLDSVGIMRAMGRLRKAHVEYQTKTIIPPSHHWAVKIFLGKCAKHGTMRMLNM